MDIARSQYSKELMDSQVKMGIAKGKLQQAADLLPVGEIQDSVLHAIQALEEAMRKQAEIINNQ